MLPQVSGALGGGWRLKGCGSISPQHFWRSLESVGSLPTSLRNVNGRHDPLGVSLYILHNAPKINATLISKAIQQAYARPLVPRGGIPCGNDQRI